jgi:hypothetical protein
MPTCMGLGEAAGTGVGLAARSQTLLHEVPGQRIRAAMNGWRQPALVSTS